MIILLLIRPIILVVIIQELWAFIVYEYQKIVIFFLKKADEIFLNAQYCLDFYNYDLEFQNEVPKDSVDKPNKGTGIFFKGFLIKDRWAAFIYFKSSDSEEFVFEVGELKLENSNYYNFDYRIKKELTISSYTPDTYKDFCKIDEKRFILVSTNRNSKLLIFILFDIYNNFNNYKIRKYQYNNFIDVLIIDIQGYIFNGYIVLSLSSVKSSNQNQNTILMFFGYANGTDFSIDILPYIMDIESYDNNNNIFDKLIENCKIDNNIFGYEIVQKINLVYYPEELLFYTGSGEFREENPLPNNSFLDADHTLYQNKEIIKTNKYYYLDYQFLVKEPVYEDFYAPSNIFDDNTNGYFIDEFKQKTFYGRTNRLYFKLCNEYCESCSEFGENENNQKCLKCSEEYSFDYWHYINMANIFCVPKEYYYDRENENIIRCDLAEFKYFNVSNDKTICFKSDYECPPEYPLLNITSNECMKNNMPSNFQIKIQDLTINISKDDIGENKLFEEPKDSLLVKIGSSNFFKNNMNMNKTTINLGTCEDTLRNSYNISYNSTLYILIIDIIQKGMKIPRVEYEVYNIINDTYIMPLNLSLCKDEKIEISIPVEITENIDKYNPRSGYYNDICYPAKSKSNTDICLDDRRDEFIKNNMSLCEENCDMIGYDYTYKKVKCSCFIKINLPIIDEVKIDYEKLKQNFIDINNIANIECIKCYKRAFQKDIIYNYGFYILTFIIILYLICLILFSSKFYKDYEKEINDYFFEINSNKTPIRNESINKYNKESQAINLNVNKIIKGKKSKKNKKKKAKIQILTGNYSSFKNDKSFKDKENLIKEEKKENLKKLNVKENYNDIELNLLPYKEALIQDKRTFVQYYFSFLRIKHSFIFSFYPNKDYNAKIIKMFLFFFFFSSHITINAFFFIDSTIHKIYDDRGDFNLAYKIPIIIYSSIISGVLNAIIKYLSLTQSNIIQIRLEIQKDSYGINEKKKKLFKTLKIKFCIFFIICFIILLFFWFYIICFCGIYKNTQIHLIKDSLFSYYYL